MKLSRPLEKLYNSLEIILDKPKYDIKRTLKQRVKELEGSYERIIKLRSENDRLRTVNFDLVNEIKELKMENV